jgi:hypothetical protein
MKKTSPSDVLAGILEPVGESLNEVAARALIGLRADSKTQSAVERLAVKCNEGKLTNVERAEYEAYVIAGELVAILQAKARVVLARAHQSA